MVYRDLWFLNVAVTWSTVISVLHSACYHVLLMYACYQYGYFTTCRFREGLIFTQKARAKIKPLVSRRKRFAKMKTREMRIFRKSNLFEFFILQRLKLIKSVKLIKIQVLGRFMSFNVSMLEVIVLYSHFRGDFPHIFPKYARKLKRVKIKTREN